MFFSRLKISTKLVISSAVFLIPIGVMLFFICFNTAGTIKKNADSRDGVLLLRPAVTAIRLMPEYYNVYLGLQQGDLKHLDDQITGALRTFGRGFERYKVEGGYNWPDFPETWETLKKIDENELGSYLWGYFDFVQEIKWAIDLVGPGSRLILISDMNTYYLVTSVLTIIPEAAMRLISMGNLIRQNLYGAESVIERWNSDLAASQAQGRRLTTKPFRGNHRDIPMSMLTIADIQVFRNASAFIISDRDRISDSLDSVYYENRKKQADSSEGWESILQKHREASNNLASLTGRMAGFNNPNPSTLGEFMDGISLLNADLCELWSEAFVHLDRQLQRNTAAAKWQLILYLVVVLVSLGIAFFFVVFISRDINRSVGSLKTLFKGLNENDLTMTLQVNSKDEFGDLMTVFNAFLNILRSTFGSFKKSTRLMADSVFDLSSSSKEITTTANEQSTSVSEIVSTMEGSKNLSEQIAHKTTEVANLAKETQELSSKGAELREANQNMMEDIRNQNQKIISEIRNLSDMIIRISEAIRIIDSIADQTKLIAFNASLEASSSGEAGARFSVVASEIRRFADNVVESTKEIKQKIEEVQGASQALIAEANSGSRQIEMGYERMSEQKIVFEHIVDNSQNVATRSQQISNLSKQQELASSQIFTALKEISAGVKQFVVATSSTSKIADSLNGMSEELKGKVDKYRTET